MSTVIAEQYLQDLWQLYSENTPINAILLPNDETIYEIDLNTRTAKAPSFLSVKKEQAAETIYFLIDRFFGDVDLANTACVIEYRNNKGTESFYPVPFYDLSTYSSHVVSEYIEIAIRHDTYQKNKYYIKNENNYIISTEDYNENQIYYMKNDLSNSKKYIYVNNITKDIYQPSKYYYFKHNYSYVILDSSKYEPNTYYIKVDNDYILASDINYNENEKYYIQEVTGTYVLDHSIQYNPTRKYYISIDKRYIKAQVEYSNYKTGVYYILNQNNEMELSTNAYDANIDYYTLIDKPKILFPWCIVNKATSEAGILEFTIRFYQIDNETGKLIYNMKTLTSQTKILDTLEVEITDDEFEDVKNSLSGVWYENLGREATVLEDIYFKIAAIDRAIYWEEA